MYNILQTEPCVVLAGPNERLRLCPVDSHAVRITATMRTEFLPAPDTRDLTPVVPDPAPCGGWTVDTGPGRLTLRGPALTVEADLSDGTLCYRDASGAVYTREPSGARKLRPIRLEGGRPGAPDAARDAYEARLFFDFGDEALYGFGSHEEGYGDLRGHTRDIYQQNRKDCVPVLVSTRGYGVLFDCRSAMRFQDAGGSSYVWCRAVEELDYYFLAGPAFADVQRAYRRLTGPAPMLPRWVFGYGQSKCEYRSAGELLDVVAEYRRRDIPLAYIVQDWQTWEPGLWGQKSFDASRFPDPDGLTRSLHDQDVAMMISVWPRLEGDGANRREMLAAGCMLGDGINYNALSAAARRLYWRQAEAGLFCHGIDGWWCDCSEPYEEDCHGTWMPEPYDRFRMNVEVPEKYMDPAQWMTYSLCHARGVYEGQRASGSDKRVVNLTRSSFAGQHRYATLTWSGDINGTWDTMARQIPEGLNFCATGEPYWNLDIGGFFVAPCDPWYHKGHYADGCGDLGYRELYTRWLQLGCFLPMMRSHGCDTPREIWRFGEPGTPFYDAIARFIRLRSRLVPYLYALAGAVTRRGGGFIAPLGLSFPDDPACRAVNDEFLLGPSLLVCPVTRPMYYGAGSRPLEDVPRTRPVYLPAGSAWYDLWTGERLPGGRWVEADAPLDKIPLYLKAGGILPLGPVCSSPLSDPHPPLTLLVAPGADGDFLLYDDEGDSYRYEQGAFSETPLHWSEAAGTLTVGPRQGCFPGQPDTTRFTVRLLPTGAERTADVGSEGAVFLFA